MVLEEPAAFDGLGGVLQEHSRLRAGLRRHDHDRWLHGSIEDVIAFQFREPPSSDDFEILHSRDRWQSGVSPSKASPRRDNMVT
ncbi:hypothetical protein [Agrobacterium vitis]|uniref:hypothetical protein n=1 Tax=Agrobacterium vitis TaxID=373 RepID=UPI001F463FC0|nr:hypothetical protein [Agrobacterium vitis]